MNELKHKELLTHCVKLGLSKNSSSLRSGAEVTPSFVLPSGDAQCRPTKAAVVPRNVQYIRHYPVN